MSDIKKRKKKRSFMQQMKKMNRRGFQGRGGNLPSEIYTYYFTLYEDLQKVENEEKDILIQRVLRELVKEEKVTLLASNQLGSRMLEQILADAPTKLLFPVIDAFSEDLRPSFVDQFSSHEGAMEKMENFEDKQIPVDENSKSKFIAFLLKVSKFTYNNLEDFIAEKYSSFIVRTVLEICSGVEISAPVKKNVKLQSFHCLKDDEIQVVEVPESLISVYHEILERIEHLPQFEDTQRIVSLASHIIEHGFMKLDNGNAEVHPVFADHSTCRLMEVLMSVVPEKNQELIYRAFFQDQMMKLVNLGIGWHAVDKLFGSWKSKELFASVINAHTDCLKEAFLLRKCKILHSVVRSCRKLNTCQKEIVKIIFEICECDPPEHRFVGPILHLLQSKEYEEKKETDPPTCSIIGSYILQEMLHFRKTNTIAKGIVEMSFNELFKIACDPRGSHVIDAFFCSPSVGGDHKVDLFKKLKGKYVALACSVYGSFIVENIFNFLNINMKMELCEELIKSSSQLTASPRGFIISKKLQLEQFNANRNIWSKKMEKLSQKKLFLTRIK
ncbi:Nucleolar protein 9 [Armadillidium nasatum]|uniref:Nucleolar protein 9 n=1 Tax=Armadillidium nasatum TaxID=96803 RepID=A0A5N5SPB4_9CRUS|nr:Nucleolar protein 9 [Armadillidium nasatum]